MPGRDTSSPTDRRKNPARAKKTDRRKAPAEQTIQPDPAQSPTRPGKPRR
jgi:hypothetical protein